MYNQLQKPASSAETSFLIVGILFGVLNAITVMSPTYSSIVAIAEYVVVLGLLLSKKYKRAFYFFVLFTCIAIEQDGFVLGDATNSNFLRYHFFRAPVVSTYLFYLLPPFFYYKLKSININKPPLKEVSVFKRWLFVLMITGVASIILGMFLDDNGIISSGEYPKRAILEILSFSSYFFVFLTAINLTNDEKGQSNLGMYCQLILVVVVLSALIATFIFGVRGWYSIYIIMLTPISIALCPLLVLFFNRNINTNYKVLSLVSGFLIIIASFVVPTCIGSKWYLIIFFALLGWVLLSIKIKSVGIVAITGFVLLTLVIINSDLILGKVSNDYVSYKLSQTLNLLNVFNSSSSFSDSFQMLDNSTLYRFDEPANIFIEYTNKPFYSIFGKGFGGTIRHYTDILSWETDSGSFSDAQIKMGAYYNMHETLATIFLRHGILGIVFLIYVISFLIKRLTKTPWAMIALVWFLFYWAYGLSSIVGAIAIVLALSESGERGKNELFNDFRRL